jgi:hypothetical protein
VRDGRTGGLPQVFCWTRFGTEAGEPIERILERKEMERLINDGIFLWGIGNSVAPGMSELVRRCDSPEVLFSAIKSRPRDQDTEPAGVVTWRSAQTMSGQRFELPPTLRVTSRRKDATATARHYALVCSCSRPLEASDLGKLTFPALRNLRSGRALGHSQVTAIVSHANSPATAGAQYVVALRATLVAPYFIRLLEPTPAGGEP